MTCFFVLGDAAQTSPTRGAILSFKTSHIIRAQDMAPLDYELGHLQTGGIFEMARKFGCVAVANAVIAGIGLDATPASADDRGGALLITAKYLFDGVNFAPGDGKAVLVRDGRIVYVGSGLAARAPYGVQRIDVPNGTILPGFIDTHTHHVTNQVPVVRMMQHGVITARDLGGPITPIDTGKPYKLRQILSGPIITAPGGYPMPVFPASGVEVSGTAAATAKVQQLVAGGAKVIALSLEPGGEPGAPWSSHIATALPPWPTLSDAEVAAIVAEAHRLRKRVVAYLGNADGVRRAVAAGIDEWAHMPCDPVPEDVWHLVASQKPAIGGTLDTLVACAGVAHNAAHAAEVGARFIYGTDLSHPDIPHGVDAQEIHKEVHAFTHTGKIWPEAMTMALASATDEAGKYLYERRETNEPNLGKLVPGAPADIIVIGSNPIENFKELEYPRAVIAGGRVVIQRDTGE